MIARLKANWQALTLIGAILAAGAAGAHEWVDLKTEVAANTSERRLQTYDRLLRKYLAEGRLSSRDTIKFCHAARSLHIGGQVVASICK